MGFMERVWSWLTSTARDVPRKDHPNLDPIDVAKLTKELRIVEEAKRLGEAGLPPPNAQVLSGPEAHIVQHVEKARQKYVNWAVLRVGILNQDLTKTDVTKAINRARQADKEFESQVSRLLGEQQAALRNLGEVTLRRQEELDVFKLENKIRRDANYPSTGRRVMLYGVLVLMIVLEGVANSFFFAEGVSSGLLGGFAFAGLFAAINVILAYSLGRYGVREIGHLNPGRRILGLAALAVALVGMVVVGLGIAHIRDALTAALPDATNAALQTLIASPFQLSGVPSWVLFGISVLFAVFALSDGLAMDDKYPGYGDVSRRAKLAADDYEAELDDLRADLESLKDAQLVALENEIHQSQASVATFDNLINDKTAVKSRLSHALHDAENSMDALLKKFRTENEICRKDLPRPAYFDSIQELKPLTMPDLDTVEDSLSLARQRDLVNMLLAEVQVLRARIQESFNQQYDRLKPLDSHFSRRESI